MPTPTPLCLDLLDRSGASLREACLATASRERYLKAHLAALRAAAALVGARTRRDVRTGRGLWEALAAVAPELGEWATYFAASGGRSRRMLRGPVPVSSRDADDLVRAAQTFADRVAALLGAPPMPGAGRLTPITR